MHKSHRRNRFLLPLAATAWMVLVLLLLSFRGEWIYWALLIAWGLLQVVTVSQQTDLYQPWRRVERKRNALGSQILEIAHRHQDAGVLVPYGLAVNYLDQKIAHRRLELTYPGSTGDTSALDEFIQTLQPLRDRALKRDGFEPVPYCLAAIRICKDWVPGDEMYQNLGPSMLGCLGETIEELEPLVAHYNQLHWVVKARRYKAAFEDGVRRYRRWFRT